MGVAGINTEANQMETWHGIRKFTVIVLAILHSGQRR
jgi:hypothetical protein